MSEKEQFTLGTNVLSIGNNRILSLPVNKQVNEQLRHHQFEVIEVDITEIIKSGFFSLLYTSDFTDLNIQ